MGWECFCVVGFDLGPLLQGRPRILYLQCFFKYVLTYFLHLNNYLVTFLHNTICREQLFCPFFLSASGISFKYAVQLPFTVFLYSTFPDNYAFLSLSPTQIKNAQSADTVPIHGHSPLVMKAISLSHKRFKLCNSLGLINVTILWILVQTDTAPHVKKVGRRLKYY